MKNIALILFSLLVFNACNQTVSEIKTATKVKTDFTKYVNPFIGTSKMGHVFPGATAPFGMVQLSPKTNTR